MRTDRFWILGVALLAGCAAPDAVQHLPGPISLYKRNRPDGWWFAARVIDAMTGAPIPGATVYAIAERDRPSGGEFWFDRAWHADADGFVRAPFDEACGNWFLTAADGYGTASSSSAPTDGIDNVIPLMPGIDWPVEVQDACGRPQAGVEVGLCLGCGHTPDVLVATTGADGIAVLRGVEPTSEFGGSGLDLYPRGPDLSPDYSESSWHPGDPPTVLRQQHTPFVSGRVLSPNGRPLAGVAIRSDFGLHRGPWTTTDADGHFGPCPHDGQLLLYLDSREYRVHAPAVARSFDIVLPTARRDAATQKADVSIAVRDAVTGEPVRRARVWLQHVGVDSGDPAESVSTETDAHGQGRYEVRAGAVGLRVEPALRDDEELPPTYETHRRDLVLPPGATAELVVELQPRPIMQVRAAEHVREALLETLEGTYRLDIPAGGELALPVPGTAPFSILCRGDDKQERRYLFSSPAKEALELQLFPPTRVALRVVDADGAPLLAKVWLLGSEYGPDDEDEPQQRSDRHGAVELRTGMVGRAFLLVVPDDTEHRGRKLVLGLPRSGPDCAVDLGDVVLPAVDAPLLRVLRADGSAAPATLTLLRPGMTTTDDVAEDGSWDGVTPQTGDHVRVRFEVEDEHDTEPAPGSGTARAVIDTMLTGPGPWVLREGPCSVRLTVRDDFGLWPEQGQVVFGAQTFNVEHQLELRGLPAGDCELFVGAEGCDSAKVRVRVDAGVTREVEVVLRRER